MLIFTGAFSHTVSWIMSSKADIHPCAKKKKKRFSSEKTSGLSEVKWDNYFGIIILEQRHT